MGWGTDLRGAVRALSKAPSFTLTVVITLSLGIGATCLTFAVLNAVLLRPLPYPEPDRVVTVWEANLGLGWPEFNVSPPNFLDWRRESSSLTSLAAVLPTPFSLLEGEEPMWVAGARASATLFPALGLEARLGRTFLATEDDPGGEPVVVLAHGLWQRQFGADPEVVGQTLNLSGQLYTVVGVMGPEADFPADVDLWVPMAFAPPETSLRQARILEVIGRLAPGVSVDQASADLNTIAEQLAANFPDTNQGWSVSVVPLHEQQVGGVRQALLLLLGAVGLLMLIPCATVANLLLMGATGRKGEIAIRAALGASPGRIRRLVLLESLLLALMGGALGTLLAAGGIQLMRSLGAGSIPRLDELVLDLRVLAFTLGISLLAGLLFGLTPALDAARPDLGSVLRSTGGRASGGRGGRRLQNLFVVVQVALALALLIGAGLLVRSFAGMLAVDPGFTAENRLTLRLELAPSQYPGQLEQEAFFTQVLEKVSALPDTRAAALALGLPLTQPEFATRFKIEDRAETAPGEEWGLVGYDAVSPDFFAVMGIPLREGRLFTTWDRRDTPAVAVINETMARRYWPDESPIGKRISIEDEENPGDLNPREVVGVVRDIKRTTLAAEPRAELYVPYVQRTWPFLHVIAETRGKPGALASDLRRAVWAVDPLHAVASPRSLEDVASASLAQPRFQTALLSAFGLLALVLAAVGIAGVIANAVGRRRREIAVRNALGASSGHILRLLLGWGLALVGVGLATGLAAAAAGSRLLAQQLYGVTPIDVPTYLGMAVILGLVSLVAILLPALRALRIEPIEVLREQ